MPGLLYTHPNDDYIGTLIRAGAPENITTSATSLAGYEVANIGNEDPAFPFRTDDTSVEIDVDCGSEVPIGLIVIVHANFDPDLVIDVVIDGNTYSVPVLAWQEDDFPTNWVLDLEAEGFSIPTDQNFSIANATPNSVGISIGEIIACAGWRDLGRHFQANGNAIDDEDHPSIKNRTESGSSKKLTQGSRVRPISGDVLDTNDGDDEKVRRWNRNALGDVRPFLIDPKLPIAEPWYVTFRDSRLPRKRLMQDEETGQIIHGYSLAFEEVGRGLKPDPLPL